MLITLVALGSILTALIGLPTLWIMVRQYIRESRGNRDSKQAEAIAKAVADAVAPWKALVKDLRERLTGMTQERDYHRNHVDELESELRGKN